MKLTLVSVALAMLVGEASPDAQRVAAQRSKSGEARAKVALRVRKLLPKGWTLETRGLPEGVQGLALGPPTDIGRPVVLLSILEAQPDPDELASRRARAFLAEQVDASPAIEATQYSAENAIEGATQFGSITKDREVRYLISSGKPSYLLTIVAPKETFEETWRQMVDLATRLRVSTKRD